MSPTPPAAATTRWDWAASYQRRIAVTTPSGGCKNNHPRRGVVRDGDRYRSRDLAKQFGELGLLGTAV